MEIQIMQKTKPPICIVHEQPLTILKTILFIEFLTGSQSKNQNQKQKQSILKDEA